MIGKLVFRAVLRGADLLIGKLVLRAVLTGVDLLIGEMVVRAVCGAVELLQEFITSWCSEPFWGVLTCKRVLLQVGCRGPPGGGEGPMKSDPEPSLFILISRVQEGR